jgi:hypothetical protein
MRCELAKRIMDNANSQEKEGEHTPDINIEMQCYAEPVIDASV